MAAALGTLALMYNRLLRAIGRRMASYLAAPRRDYSRFSLTNTELLMDTLQSGDILLIEGNSRISRVIQLLTQSTWSHACICVGPNRLVEADLLEGVIEISADKYASNNSRICRPIGLSPEDRKQVASFVCGHLGYQYDTRNIIDLARWFLPVPPVSRKMRERLIGFGSGDPTRAICSTMIAQAFQELDFPILPLYCEDGESCPPTIASSTLRHRHFTHFTPRDFDLSPYFEVIKPLAGSGFDYREMQWSEDDGESTPL